MTDLISEFVYIGLRVGWEDNATHNYLEVRDGKADPDRRRTFKTKIHKLGGPGSRLRVTATRTADILSVYTHGDKAPITIGMYEEDPDLVATWISEDAAARKYKQIRTFMGRLTTRRFDLERLRPFRNAYLNLSGLQRAAMLTSVIGFITQGEKPATKKPIKKSSRTKKRAG